MKSFRMGVLFLSFIFAGFAQAADAPDWAVLMRGRWKGEGVRVEVSSRTKTRLEMDVESQWVDGPAGAGLVSRNHIRETVLSPGGTPIRSKEYDRVYWISEISRAGQTAQLILGGGETPGQGPTSSASYNAQLRELISSQLTGGNLKLEFTTRFETPNVQTQERIWYGSTLYSEAKIVYSPSND